MKSGERKKVFFLKKNSFYERKEHLENAVRFILEEKKTKNSGREKKMLKVEKKKERKGKIVCKSFYFNCVVFSLVHNAT